MESNEKKEKETKQFNFSLEKSLYDEFNAYIEANFIDKSKLMTNVVSNFLKEKKQQS